MQDVREKFLGGIVAAIAVDAFDSAIADQDFTRAGDRFTAENTRVSDHFANRLRDGLGCR